MSRILHLVNIVLGYNKSKGVREHRLEEPPLGILAVTCHLEESASHHFSSLQNLSNDKKSNSYDSWLRPFADSNPDIHYDDENVE